MEYQPIFEKDNVKFVVCAKEFIKKTKDDAHEVGGKASIDYPILGRLCYEEVYEIPGTHWVANGYVGRFPVLFLCSCNGMGHCPTCRLGPHSAEMWKQDRYKEHPMAEVDTTNRSRVGNVISWIKKTMLNE